MTIHAHDDFLSLEDSLIDWDETLEDEVNATLALELRRIGILEVSYCTEAPGPLFRPSFEDLDGDEIPF